MSSTFSWLSYKLYHTKYDYNTWGIKSLFFSLGVKTSLLSPKPLFTF